MNKKSKPSLYRGDYYTIEEYEELTKFLNKDLLSRIIKATISKGPAKIKRSIQNLSRCTKDFDRDATFVYDLMYMTPYDDVPLFINRSSTLISICQWRLQINK